MQGLFDAPGWNLGSIATGTPTKLSKTQQRKAFKKKKLVEEALGQATPRKPKAQKVEAEPQPAPVANKNPQKQTNKRKGEDDHHEGAAPKALPKKQKPNGKPHDQRKAPMNADNKSTREATKPQHTKPASTNEMQVESKLSIGQGINRSNYVSVLSADGQDVYTAPPAAAVTQQWKQPNKKAKKVAEVTEKPTEQPSAKPTTTTSDTQGEAPLSKRQKKKLEQEQRQQANSTNTAESDSQPKPAPTAPTKKVNEKQKKKLQAVLAKSASANTKTSTIAATADKSESSVAKQETPKQNKQKAQAKTEEPSKQAPKLTALQQKMKDKLSGSRFRWLNEQLYTTPGDESFALFQEKPELFDHYHEGFRHQVESWPTNPVDVMIDYLRSLPTSTVIADFGCGDAKIAHTLTKHKVLSFDLVAKNDKVVACDIAKLPIPNDFIDVSIFCLSLMGTNYVDFIREAHRVLKEGGELKIAEVVSRFSDVDAFIEIMSDLGFEFMDKDDTNKMFMLLDFVKKPNYDSVLDTEDSEMLKGLNKKQKKAFKKGLGGSAFNASTIDRKAKDLLKPCLYKKR